MLPHARQASRRVVVGYVWWCCGLMYVIACEWWQGCMAWQAPCSRIELSGVLPISVVSSVAQTQFGSLCCIPASKAFVPLVDLFLVGAPHGAAAGPQKLSLHVQNQNHPPYLHNQFQFPQAQYSAIEILIKFFLLKNNNI